MDEAGGFCGLIAIVLVLVLGFVVWTSSRPDPDPAPGAGAVASESRGRDRGGRDGLGPPASRSIGPPAILAIVGALYVGGLFFLRPRARRAKRNGATDQQAALIALLSFAFSPVVVPVHLAWGGLGLLGRALTSGPDSGDKPKPHRGANDLD
ncbi:hypothetical protein [Tautonia plasticadhaerens]|uniref:Uncharacterized protein n=1 Tax=Tautonia plasticadhaerens TaxID=2527974 RepID=A0A518GVS9_9BACT|nr:hypothetical protein [Tautonia plasticadhaerens]QDV32703.1 hypothetical protein ElP_05420 [Tautonia plasticadhaerens]